MTIAQTLKGAADAPDWPEYAIAVGLGADQLVPAIREMERRGFETSQISAVLKHMASLVHPTKRKNPPPKPQE